MGTHGLGKEKEALANSQPSREVGGGEEIPQPLSPLALRCQCLPLAKPRQKSEGKEHQ